MRSESSFGRCRNSSECRCVQGSAASSTGSRSPTRESIGACSGASTIRSSHGSSVPWTSKADGGGSSTPRPGRRWPNTPASRRRRGGWSRRSTRGGCARTASIIRCRGCPTAPSPQAAHRTARARAASRLAGPVAVRGRRKSASPRHRHCTRRVRLSQSPVPFSWALPGDDGARAHAADPRRRTRRHPR